MSQSRGSVDQEEERDVQETARSDLGTCRTLDDEADRRKSQAQRLLEFEMWTNDNTLRDLEYSQRRTDKKQRRRERRKHYQKRCWKKLYLPAVLGMLTGTFLTLCATLQSMAGDTFLWDIRGTLLILGPILLGAGFLTLMLSAGCTFKHDHEARQKPRPSPPEFVKRGFEFQYSRPSTAPRSVSTTTTDLPLPEDLEPSRDCAQSGAGWLQSGKGTGVRSVSKDDSVTSDGPLTLGKNYSSTAMWVHFVSAAHRQRDPSSPTQQNGGSHLGSSSARSQGLQEGQGSLESAEEEDQFGSRSDLHVVRTRSVTSSGYHSASDSASGTVEYQMSCENSQGIKTHCSHSPFKHNSRRLTNHVPTNNQVGGAVVVEVSQRAAGDSRGSEHSGAQHTTCPGLARPMPKPNVPQQYPSSHRQSTLPVTASRPQFLHSGTKHCRNTATSEARLHNHRSQSSHLQRT